jgi:hypothetical protein
LISLTTHVDVLKPNINIDNISESAFTNKTEEIKQQYQEKLDIANDEILKLRSEITTLKVSISEIGRERDFYYSKLRDFEMLTHKNPAIEKDELMKLIKTIIFAEKEIELQIDESGNINIKNL